MAEPNRPNFKIIKYTDETPLSNPEVGVVLYARDSTEFQAGSCDDQLRALRRAIDGGKVRSRRFPNSKLVIKCELKDEGYSGFSIERREQLSLGLSLLAKREASILVVLRLDRASRNMMNSLEISDQIEEWNAELISVSDDYSSADKGSRLKLMNRAWASEELLENISMDTHRGLNERRIEGCSDGHLWFGVSSTPTEQSVVKGKIKDSFFRYYILEDQAAVVRRIFLLSSSGHSQKEIAQILNADGILPPSCYDKHGKIKPQARQNATWRDKTVWNVLHNKGYIGIVERGKTTTVKMSDGGRRTVNLPKAEWIVTEHPDLKIISDELWNAVRDRYEVYNLAKLKAGIPGNRPFKHGGKTEHILTSLFSCETCGGPIVVVGGKKGGYYGCRNGSKWRSCTNTKTIHWKKLEEPFLELVAAHLKDEKIATAIALKYNDLKRKRNSSNDENLFETERELEETNQKIGNLVNSIENGHSSQAVLLRLAELERQKASLEVKKQLFKKNTDGECYVTPSAIIARLREVPNLLRTKKPFEVNKALKPLIGKEGLKLVRTANSEKREVFKILGTMNLGRALSQEDGALHDLSMNPISLEVKVDLLLD